MDQHFCHACGHQLGPGDLFCTACGTRSATADSSSPASATVVRAPIDVEPAEATAVRRAVLPPPAPRPRKRRSRRRFWACVTAAAVLVAGASYGLGMVVDGDDDRLPTTTTVEGTPAGGTPGAASSPTGSAPDPKTLDPQAVAQAKALRTLIGRSAADKQRIAAAAAQLQSCRHLGQAIQTFQDAAASRDRLVDQAAELQVGLLPGGGAAIASFSRALRASADADRAYVAWGEARHKVRHKCRGGKQLQQRAVRMSSASHESKQQTAQAWNVIAAQFGMAAITWNSL